MLRAMGPTASEPGIEGVGRRKRSRLRARLAAKLVTLDGSRNTVLLDLSLTGARIKAAPNLCPGREGVLSWSCHEAFGTIVWVAHGLCGMEFDEPLDPAVLLATRDLDATSRLPSDRDLERNLLREWVDGERRV